MIVRSYTELSKLDSFDERFEYLVLSGAVGRETFGFDRWINQEFYRSRQWKSVREFVIVRDNGCDLGVSGFEIPVGPLVHHMNPMGSQDIIHSEEWILDPEFLITTSHETHNDIHYSGVASRTRVPVERTRGDTKLW